MPDITVLGAGIFGLSVAWACQSRGAAVRVVDPAGVAAGASGGIVGALAPHVPERWNAKKAFQLESLLAACRDAHMPMGIISNAQFYTPCLFKHFLGADVRTLGFADDLTIYSFKTGRGKPSLYLFQLARAKLQARGLKTKRVLFVGNDMLNDIYPAQQVGFQTALFAGDQRSLRLRPDDPRCVNLKPDVVITDLDQLLDHIA